MIQLKYLSLLLLSITAKPTESNLQSDFHILEQEFRSKKHDENYFNSIDGTMEVMVQVKTSESSSFHLSNLIQDTEVNSKDFSISGLKVNEEQLDILKKDPSIQRIEPNHKVTIVDKPIDNESLKNRKLEEILEWNVGLVMQDYSFFREKSANGSVKVCIADTGYDYYHNDLPKMPNVDGTDGEGESWMYDGNGEHSTCFIE